MDSDVYRALARHLDNLPGGYPATESGVELRILRRLFTPEEAALATRLTLIAEAPPVIARRAKMDVAQAASLLETMAAKGLIYALRRTGVPPRYMAAQFAVGIWEFHVNDLDPELVADVNEYFPTIFPEAWRRPQLRTVPVGKSLSPRLEVMTYERAEALIREMKTAVVAPCICRRECRIKGEGCDAPLETCLTFDQAGDYYLRNGLGRQIDIHEALDLLCRADDAGLVIQPTNAQKIINICLCCGCCCGVLRHVRQLPRPAELVNAAFRVTLDPDICEACGTCIERCQMGALMESEDGIHLAADRCIGCGLCVTRCPVGALSLERRPDVEQAQIPADMMECALSLGRARGKITTPGLVKMLIRSKVDRLLALVQRSS